MIEPIDRVGADAAREIPGVRPRHGWDCLVVSTARRRRRMRRQAIGGLALAVPVIVAVVFAGRSADDAIQISDAPFPSTVLTGRLPDLTEYVLPSAPQADRARILATIIALPGLVRDEFRDEAANRGRIRRHAPALADALPDDQLPTSYDVWLATPADVTTRSTPSVRTRVRTRSIRPVPAPPSPPSQRVCPGRFRSAELGSGALRDPRIDR